MHILLRPALKFAFQSCFPPPLPYSDIHNVSTYDLIATIDIGNKLDDLQYDARSKRLYVGCTSPGKSATSQMQSRFMLIAIGDSHGCVAILSFRASSRQTQAH
jgi:hypothetical protein